MYATTTTTTTTSTARNASSDFPELGDDDEDFLTQELLRASQQIDRGHRHEHAEKASSESSASSSEDDTSVFLRDDVESRAPGYAPDAMFSPRNLKNSVILGAPPASTYESLRFSQLMPDRIEESLEGIRASQVRQNLQQFEQLVGGGGRGLSQSQSASLNVYLGSFGETLSQLEILINRYIDDPEKLATLLSLHETISETLKKIDMNSIAAPPPPQPAPGGNGNFARWAEEEAWDPFAYERILAQEAAARNEKEEEYVESDHEGAEQMECLICMDDIWFPSRRSYKFDCCSSVYCKNCLQENYKVQIDDGKVLDLKCPNPTCAKGLTEEQMADIVKEETFKRYQQFYLLASLRKDPTVRWCPKIGCETPVQGGSAEEPHLKCDKCQLEFCWHCNHEWHEGKPCKWAQRQAARKNKKKARADKKAEKYVKKKSRPCPQCGTPIQKNKGCNHMTCQGCKYQFCWLCMGKFDNYNHFSTGKCKGMQNWSSKYAKYGTYIGIGVGGVAVVGIAIPVVAVAGPPVAAVGLPIYGAYKLMKI